MARARCPRSSVESGQKCVRSMKEQHFSHLRKMGACLHQLLNPRNENMYEHEQISTASSTCVRHFYSKPFESLSLFGRWRSMTSQKKAPHSMRGVKCRTVKITVFSSAIVIDVIDHCHTAGALLESNSSKHLSLSSCCGCVLIRSGQFQNRIGSGAGKAAH